VLFVTGVHEEATNEDLKEHFSDCGKVLNMWMNLDRQTGYVKVRHIGRLTRGTFAHMWAHDAHGPLRSTLSVAADRYKSKRLRVFDSHWKSCACVTISWDCCRVMRSLNTGPEKRRRQPSPS
jgi:RNA recognition motif-containing protein